MSILARLREMMRGAWGRLAEAINPHRELPDWHADLTSPQEQEGMRRKNQEMRRTLDRLRRELDLIARDHGADGPSR